MGPTREGDGGEPGDRESRESETSRGGTEPPRSGELHQGNTDRTKSIDFEGGAHVIYDPENTEAWLWTDSPESV